MKKTVTVAIPVYNAEKYIMETLLSVADQTCGVDQLLICDNKSTDNTIQLINQFIKQNPKVPVLLQQNEINIGPHRNFNKCMELCSTDLLLILGADDKLKPPAIQRYHDFFSKNSELGLIGGFTDFINEKGEVTGESQGKQTEIYQKGEILEYIKGTNLFMQHSTVMLNTKCSKEAGYWDVGLIGADERYYVKILVKHPIARMAEALVFQRLHSGQAVRNENADFKGRIKHFKENIKIADLETDPKRQKESKKILKNWESNFCRAITKLELQDSGNLMLAIKYWLYGISRNPNYFIHVYSRKAKHGFQKLIEINN